jgi:ATPase complex subunit ATP10
LPGNLIYKTYKWTGNTRKVPVELAKGYFWMVSDLKKTNSKPTLCSIIPEREAQTFPTLTGLYTLIETSTKVDIPWYFIDPSQYQHGEHVFSTSKSKCVTGNVTLLSITFRDNGFKLIPSWTKPFETVFQNDDRVQSYKLSVTEQWVLYPLRGLLTRVMKNNTPSEDQNRTLVYFGSSKIEEFRDVLRMHNIMTNYVFLLDDLGRIRFAGSGMADDDEITQLVQTTKDVLKESDGKGVSAGRGQGPQHNNKK